LAQRIKYLSALEEMLNTNYYHLWEMGKLTKEQFRGVLRNVINQIKKEPSRGKAFSHQHAFEYFLVIDDDAYNQAYAYK
jgi:hypothetical protein